MSVMKMAREKGSEKKANRAPSAPPGETEEVKVNVYPAERELINKVAGARGQKVAEFFKSKDVRTFLTHLLVAAGKTEAERLAEEDKP